MIVTLKEGVAKFKVFFAAFEDFGTESIGFLVYHKYFIVVSSKRVKCPKLEESRAYLFGSISSETTDVTSYHLLTPHTKHEITDYG